MPRAIRDEFITDQPDATKVALESNTYKVVAGTYRVVDLMPQPKLSRLELRILESLWSQGKASIREIHSAFLEPHPAYTTIQTIVYRMEAKHYLRQIDRIGHADIFEPLVAREFTRNRVLDEILSFFGGKAAPMMAQLVDAGKLTVEDVQELEKTFRKLEAQKAGIQMMDAIGRHLWQSTIFALAGLLTLAFRRNRVKVRYWLWLSASVKFCVPFVLLIELGQYVDTRAPSVRDWLLRCRRFLTRSDRLSFQRLMNTSAPPQKGRHHSSRLLSCSPQHGSAG